RAPHPVSPHCPEPLIRFPPCCRFSSRNSHCSPLAPTSPCRLKGCRRRVPPIFQSASSSSFPLCKRPVLVTGPLREPGNWLTNNCGFNPSRCRSACQVIASSIPTVAAPVMLPLEL